MYLRWFWFYHDFYQPTFTCVQTRTHAQSQQERRRISIKFQNLQSIFTVYMWMQIFFMFQHNFITTTLGWVCLHVFSPYKSVFSVVHFCGNIQWLYEKPWLHCWKIWTCMPTVRPIHWVKWTLSWCHTDMTQKWIYTEKNHGNFIKNDFEFRFLAANIFHVGWINHRAMDG